MTTPCAACESPTDATLCTRCTRQLEQALAEMPALLHELDVTISRQDRGTGKPLYAVAKRRVQQPGVDYTQGTVTLPATPWPFAWDAADLRWSVEATMHAWAVGYTERRPSNPSLALVARINDVRHAPDAGQMLDEISYARTQVLRAIDQQAADVFAGLCGAPDVTAQLDDGVIHASLTTCRGQLLARIGDTEVRCPQCGALHDVQARRRTLAATMDENWATALQIADSLTTLDEPLKVNTLRSWIRRDVSVSRRIKRSGEPEPRPLIRQVGVDDAGVALYRVGDVRERIEWSRHRARSERISA